MSTTALSTGASSETSAVQKIRHTDNGQNVVKTIPRHWETMPVADKIAVQTALDVVQKEVRGL